MVLLSSLTNSFTLYFPGRRTTPSAHERWSKFSYEASLFVVMASPLSAYNVQKFMIKVWRPRIIDNEHRRVSMSEESMQKHGLAFRLEIILIILSFKLMCQDLSRTVHLQLGSYRWCCHQSVRWCWRQRSSLLTSRHNTRGRHWSLVPYPLHSYSPHRRSQHYTDICSQHIDLQTDIKGTKLKDDTRIKEEEDIWLGELEFWWEFNDGNL